MREPEPRVPSTLRLATANMAVVVPLEVAGTLSSRDAGPLMSSPSGACRVRVFIPVFSPVFTGSLACSVRGSPVPPGSRFSRYTALPSTGQQVAPFSQGSSQSMEAHHGSSSGASTKGELSR